MDRQEYLAEQFEDNRSHLRAVAYRMLGSATEAEDAVQEAWLRLNHSDAGAIENLGGWLTTVVARVCLDMLRSRKSRREEPLDPQLTERVGESTDGTNPEQEALLADSVGVALLVVLDTLTPAEQAHPPNGHGESNAGRHDLRRTINGWTSRELAEKSPAGISERLVGSRG